MNSIKFMQTDSRWGSLGYPKKPWYIRNCGCGEVSIANIIIEMFEYAEETPATIQPYCKQYADPKGNGTYHSGIPKMMQHYGLTEVLEHANMASLWKELEKGGRVAVFLMGSRKAGSKGIRWTTSGHFVAGVGYKKSGTKHMLYIKDSYSNQATRNGWISYEENMKNDVLKVWSGKLKEMALPGPDGPYKGTLPKETVKDGSKGDDVKALQNFINWNYGAKVLTVDGIAGNNTVRWIRKFQGDNGLKVDGKFGKNSRAKAAEIIAEHEGRSYDGEYPVMPVKIRRPNTEKLTDKAKTLVGSASKPTDAFKKALDKAYPDRSSWGKDAAAGKSCDVFVGTAVRSLGWDKEYPRGLAEQFLYKPAGFTRKVYKDASPYDVSKDGQIIIYSKNKVPTSKNKKTCTGHTCIRGNGVIYEANHPSKYPHANESVKKKLDVKRPYVVTLTPTGMYETMRSYMKRGDEGPEVEKLQKYINWFFADKYGKDVLAVDGNFGPDTENYAKLMQSDLGLQDPDGLVGEKTIAAMKAHKK